MAEGVIFSIQRFSLHDGPGIRTSVFLKGCNMRCAWCHNPEGIAPWPELRYIDEKCARCGECLRLCPNVHRIEHGRHTLHRDECILCGRCAEHCYSGALRMVGERWESERVLGEVLRDARYYEVSGGGMTISGGEPMGQLAFTQALLSGAKSAGIHTALETNGSAPIEQYLRLLPSVDLLLYDYKMTDPKLSEQYTGTTLYVARSNLDALAKLGVKILVRCPVIPGVNDTDEHFQAIAQLSGAGSSVLGLEIMPYHALGEAKARQIGWTQGAGFPVPEAGQIEQWKRRIQEFGGRIYA